MFAGIPVHAAIATNKLSSSTGTVVSTARLIKNKKVDWGFVPGTIIGALIGSVAGANLALIMSDHILKMVLVVLLPVVAICVLKDKNMDVEVPVGMTKSKQVVNLSSNISALVTFILAGKILWGLGLAASCFSIAGHYVGAGMVVNNGSKIIKPVIPIVLVLLMIKVVSGI